MLMDVDVGWADAAPMYHGQHVFEIEPKRRQAQAMMT